MGLEDVVDRSRHLVDGDCKVRGSRRDLDCHLVRLEEHHHLAEAAGIAAVAARIRTADAAVAGLEDCRAAAVEEEGSCTAGCQPSSDRQTASVVPSADQRRAAVLVLGSQGQNSDADSSLLMSNSC